MEITVEFAEHEHDLWSLISILQEFLQIIPELDDRQAEISLQPGSGSLEGQFHQAAEAANGNLIFQHVSGDPNLAGSDLLAIKLHPVGKYLSGFAFNKL